MNSHDVILGLLHRRPLSGYEIKQTLEQPISFFFDASFGTIYPTLSKMEQAGFITKESVVQENRPNKNVYSLTDQGRERFKAYMNSPLEDETFRSDFMVRLFFGAYQDQDTMIGWVRQMIEHGEQEWLELTRTKAQYEATMNPTQKLCVNLGIGLNSAKTALLKEGLQTLLANKA